MSNDQLNYDFTVIKDRTGCLAMNAIQFIQQHGIKKAREVVEGAPKIGSYFEVGDFVLYEKTRYTYEVVKTEKTKSLALKHTKTGRVYAMPHRVRLRLATKEEIAAGKRLDGNNAIQK